MLSSITSLYHKLFDKFWNPVLVTVIAGVLSALYFGVTQTYWAVTGEFTRLAGHIMSWFGFDPHQLSYMKIIKFQGSPLDRVDGWVVSGMLLGALMSALLGGNFKLRFPHQKRRIVQGLVGGMIAGFGARLAMGCNLASFFTGIPQFSFHAWLFMLGMATGSYVGVKAALHPLLRGKPRLEKASPGARNMQSSRSRVQPIIGLLVFCISIGLIVWEISGGHSKLGLAGLFGVAFGLLIQRGQICFTSAFRDLWVTGRGTMAKALALGIIAATLCTAVIIYLGVPQKIAWAGPGALIGGLLFGFGIVIAGGCETGWMYRAMEGQIQFVIVGIGNIIGAGILAWGWDHWGLFASLVKPYPKINLVSELGWSGAILSTVGLMLLWYAFASYWEKHVRYKANQKGQAVLMQANVEMKEIS
ncbi:selenium metabolism membrane protein YedE/FdhT [Aneurinibacillus uraniidurans]|uniref:selenium metabolism membrane protein YedE/FdhT n=1 Tax=Aneurinibacillus uraniidurans TaxID=2966586 RepID=UPI00234AF7A5|nr:selenium metabolism membrane protein YedE/FdhT [Aneurinibacillus sp. B1]WCN39422.1 selenium metabolism membrane protein YedE/FdhT [Aneurinibacillus sp. B1]